MPVVETLAILLLLATTSLGGHGVTGKDKPLSEVARSSGVRLEALALGGERVAWQATTSGLQGVHGQHEAGGARVAVLHLGTRTGCVQLVACSVFLVLVKAILTLALRLQCGVVERKNMSQRTRTPGIQFVAGVCVLVVIHLEGLVATTEADPCCVLHDNDRASRTRSLRVFFVTVAIFVTRPKHGAGTDGCLGLTIPNKAMAFRTRTSGELFVASAVFLPEQVILFTDTSGHCVGKFPLLTVSGAARLLFLDPPRHCGQHDAREDEHDGEEHDCWWPGRAVAHWEAAAGLTCAR